MHMQIIAPSWAAVGRNGFSPRELEIVWKALDQWDQKLALGDDEPTMLEVLAVRDRIAAALRLEQRSAARQAARNTVEAMQAARRGELLTVGPEGLIANHNAADERETGHQGRNAAAEVAPEKVAAT